MRVPLRAADNHNKSRGITKVIHLALLIVSFFVCLGALCLSLAVIRHYWRLLFTVFSIIAVGIVALVLYVKALDGQREQRENVAAWGRTYAYTNFMKECSKGGRNNCEDVFARYHPQKPTQADLQLNPNAYEKTCVAYAGETSCVQ